MEFLEAADLAGGRIGLEAGRGARLQAADVALQRAGGSQAEDIVEAVRLAPVEHFRAGVVAVGAQQDLHRGADRADQAAEKSPDLDAFRAMASPKRRRSSRTFSRTPWRTPIGSTPRSARSPSWAGRAEWSG